MHTMDWDHDNRMHECVKARHCWRKKPVSSWMHRILQWSSFFHSNLLRALRSNYGLRFGNYWPRSGVHSQLLLHDAGDISKGAQEVGANFPRSPYLDDWSQPIEAEIDPFILPYSGVIHPVLLADRSSNMLTLHGQVQPCFGFDWCVTRASTTGSSPHHPRYPLGTSLITKKR
jgi:hypothetical protein